MRLAVLSAALVLGAVVAAGCGGTRTETVSVTTTETETETVTETVTKLVNPPALVFVPQPGGRLLYKPDTLAAGAHAGPYNIRWKSYGGPTAVGSGTFASNDCDPSCAEGSDTLIKVTVKLTGRIPCRGLLAYSLMAIEGRGFDRGYAEIDGLGASACQE
jgi:hypothetical protein